MYKLRITAKAKRKLRLVTKEFQRRAINQALLDIQEDPTLGKPLTLELTGLWTHKVSVYRIIYRVNEKENLVIVLNAGHRATIY